jgi:iron complex outermembrane receptor protein
MLAAEDTVPASSSAASTQPTTFKDYGLEQLMDLEVTSVTRSPEKLSETASAIQVISGEDIQHSGASTLPEALRLAPNLQVAQVNASQWAISARGFDNVLSDKLLVMIDGRTVYTPLYAGVFWDVQNVMLEDVERIEVVSGPGGTLWGANAMNGVINVISKSSKDTQGLYSTFSSGSTVKDSGAIRYGGQLDHDLSFRVYGERFDLAHTDLLNGSDAHDNWYMNQGGFRMDWDPDVDSVTVQGDAYDGRPDPDGNSPVTAKGGNVIAKWKRPLSETADFQLQYYYDWTWRDFNNGFTERVNTDDVDFQNRFQFTPFQEITWGAGYRLMDDTEADLPLFGFHPSQLDLHLYSGFVQDEITLWKKYLKLTVGSKFEHNDYTGYDAEPSGRLSWTPSERMTFWGAVSRAVRTPSRTDRDFSVSLTPTLPLLEGDSSFESEKLRAFELGWRAEPTHEISLSLSTFYNEYTDIRSATPGPPPFGIPITLANAVQGNTYGAEASATAQLLPWWQMRGGYTFLKKRLEVKPGGVDANNATAESDDPEHQFLIQSSLDVTRTVRFDSILRYVAALPNPYVRSYFGLNLQVSYQPTPHLELALVGKDLLRKEHQEFVPSSPAPREIPRSFYANATVRW